MASWTDGPEYAPLERPAAFVAPAAKELAEPDTATTPSAEALPMGAEEPTFVAPTEPTLDLRALVPSAAPGRNPNLPFESLTTPIAPAETGPVERHPEDPFDAAGPALTGYLPVQSVVQPSAQLNPAPFPAPGTPAWFGPPTGQPVSPALVPVGIPEVWRATTGWVLVPLFVGMFFAPISPIALAVAWLSTAQIKYRRLAIRRTYLITGVVVTAFSLVGLLTEQFSSLYDAFAATSLLACWVLVVLTPVVVATALRRQEPPDRL